MARTFDFFQLGPPPYYLLRNTIMENSEQERFVATGTLVFPSTDETLASRGRANTYHQLIGVWNLYHVLASRGLVAKGALIREQSSKHHGLVQLDTEYLVHVEFFIEDQRGIWRLSRNSDLCAQGKVHLWLPK